MLLLMSKWVCLFWLVWDPLRRLAFVSTKLQFIALIYCLILVNVFISIVNMYACLGVLICIFLFFYCWTVATVGYGCCHAITMAAAAVCNMISFQQNCKFSKEMLQAKTTHYMLTTQIWIHMLHTYVYV